MVSGQCADLSGEKPHSGATLAWTQCDLEGFTSPLCESSYLRCDWTVSPAVAVRPCDRPR